MTSSEQHTVDSAQPPRHIVVMGVSGSGKTTLARILAEDLNLPMAEADEFHPPENIAKMSSGEPLTDADRWPWLRRLESWMSARWSTGCIITCSALRRSYRDVLREAQGDVVFLHVAVETPLLSTRLKHRSGHFMPPELLDSQLASLEPLHPDEEGITLANNASVDQLVAAAKNFIQQ